MTLAEHGPLTPPSSRSGFGGTQVWIVLGQVGVIAAVTLGFGAIELTRPKLLVLIMFVMTAGALLLGPARNIERVIITIPTVLYLGWWAVSYLWTYNPWIYMRETQVVLPLAVAMVVLASLLPFRDFTRALVTACYVAIGWSVLALVLNPGEAMSHPDGAPGWRGAFEHKNGMAPFMLFAVLTILAFEDRRVLRRTGVGTAVLLVVMSQSTTSMIVGSLLVALTWFLGWVARAPRSARAPLLLGGSVGGMLVATVAMLQLPRLVQAAGKDPTLTSRTDIWSGVLEAISWRPLTGFGIGGAWVNHAAEPTRTILRGLGFIVYHSHNGFLEIMLQLGVIGLGLFLLLLIRLATMGLGLMSVDESTGRYVVLYCALIALTSIAEVTTFGIWLVLLCALSSLIVRRQRNVA